MKNIIIFIAMLSTFNCFAQSREIVGNNGKKTTRLAIQNDNKNVALDINIFELLTPANLSTNLNFSTLELDWSDAIGATSYQIDMDVSETFDSDPITFYIDPSNYTALNLLPNTKYYWRVRATDGSDWGTYSTVWNFTTKENVSTSIHEANFSNLKLYPNPTSDYINIETNSELINKPYKIFDYSGKEMLSGIINSQILTINLKPLLKGIYLLQIGEDSKETYKLLKD
jgi:hypothetical protein